LVVDCFDLGKRVAEIEECLGHLFGVAAGVELGFLKESEAAGEVMDHFLPTGLEFHLAPPGLLEGGALAFEFFLGAFEFSDFLLRFSHPGIDLFAAWSAEVGGCGCAGIRGFVGLKITINELRWVVIRRHSRRLPPGAEAVKRGVSGGSDSFPLVSVCPRP
jgi:hypothetical protein